MSDRRARPPTVKEVARRAGVGVASVSRVLTNHPDTSEAMRVRVMRAAQDLGYAPNLLAQGLRGDKTFTIGAMFSDIANPIISKIIKGVEHVLREGGYAILLTDSEGMPRLGARNLRVFLQRRVDGLIVMPADESDHETIEILSASTLPLVVIDREFPPEVDAGYVLSDHAAGLVKATEHLLELGHRRFGLVVGPQMRPSRIRREAVEGTLLASGVPHDLNAISVDPLNAEQGAGAVQSLLLMPEPPTALVLGGNQLLEGAMRVLRDRGIQLGRDLALVASDDTPLTEFHNPPVSIVDRDAFAMGQAAGELLIRRLNGAPDTSPVVLPTRYIARGSTTPPAR